MKKTVLTFGLISGALSSLMMVATVPFAHRIGFNKALIVGYTTIVLSFLLVFFGIRSYRDNASNGQITFTKAFAVGISITLISCIFYVVTWEILYFNFMHDFMDNYGAHTIEKLKASGASPAAIQVQVQQLKKFKGSKTEQAAEVGKLLAANAKQAGVERVVFDRGGYLYHGRVKALAGAAREGGLEF